MSPSAVRLLDSGDTVSVSADPESATLTLDALSGDEHVTVTMTAIEAARFAQRMGVAASGILTTDEATAFLAEGLAVAATLLREARDAGLPLGHDRREAP